MLCKHCMNDVEENPEAHVPCPCCGSVKRLHLMSANMTLSSTVTMSASADKNDSPASAESS